VRLGRKRGSAGRHCRMSQCVSVQRAAHCRLHETQPLASNPSPHVLRTFVPIEAQRKADGSRWVVAPTMQTKGSKFVKFQEARLQVRQREKDQA
jgi:hypothetical protein